MTCAACVRRVEAALKDVPGIKDVSVNFATSKASLVYDSNAGVLPELKKALEEAGYQFLGTVSDTGDDPLETAQLRELNDLKLKLVVGFVSEHYCPRRFDAGILCVC